MFVVVRLCRWSLCGVVEITVVSTDGEGHSWAVVMARSTLMGSGDGEEHSHGQW